MKTKLQIDITPFLSKDDTCPNITKPWMWQGKLVATDGRILIVCDGMTCERDPQLPAPPPLEKALAQGPLPENPKWIPVPEIAEFLFECEGCSGGGEHECICGNIHKCETCEGSGKMVDTKLGTAIGLSKFANHYLAKIAALPNAELCEPQNSEDAMRFRFDGGYGLLMPLRK